MSEAEPTRDEMIKFLCDRKYPHGKTGYKVGRSQFLAGLQALEDVLLESFYNTAKREAMMERLRRAERKKK